MPLSPEIAIYVDAIAKLMPREMHETPVLELRASIQASLQPPVTGIHHVEDLVVPSASGGVPIRLYNPSDAVDLPVLLWMHSGGFAIGDLELCDEYLRKLSVAAGIVVVSVDYRLAPEHPYPAALEDCVAVWEWLLGGPPEVVADWSRAALGGESAGGNLAFVLAQKMRDTGGPAPDAQISLYGTADFRISNPEAGVPPMLTVRDCHWFWDMYAPDPTQRESPYVSPIRAKTVAGLPPALVITAEVDPTRDATEEYAHRMEEEGVDVELRRFEGTMHGFAQNTVEFPQARQAFETIVDFLGRRVGHRPGSAEGTAAGPGAKGAGEPGGKEHDEG